MKERIMCISTMNTLVSANKVDSYAGRIIVPIRVAETMQKLDSLFGLGWLCVSDVDTRYFNEGKFSDPYTASGYRAVFFCPSEDTEYSFENLPFYLACGFTSIYW